MYTNIVMQQQSMMRDWSMWFNDVDLVPTPVWTQRSFGHGWDAESSENAMAVIELIRCGHIGSLLNLPSAAVPAGVVDGLPVGVMLSGDRFADYLTLDAAEVIEKALAPVTPLDPQF